ncbi:hypothetical protein D6855_06060 [Butyrivibrio sp. CB08]|uniref:hypothetical protein n=1 Tax=Butyrivibrio sp. CB08 TaxID=2364879 RepID=UPI000EA99209|nr:hypothetical protein [Butyrivibrio sp. CB08]RKM61454.1 hypothetical protein D6855_06060 [Butyrivibrio sp. CB08]
MKKVKNSNKTGIILGGVIVALLAAVVFIASLLLESYRIRQFKVDVFVLCNESDICVADGPDGHVKVHDDNLPAIYSILSKAHGKVDPSDEDPVRSLNLEFECHEETWNMRIDELNTDVVRVTLSGPENKSMCFSNRGAYNEYAQAVSLKGYNKPNKALGK